MSQVENLVERVRASLQQQFAGNAVVEKLLSGPPNGFAPETLRSRADRLRSQVAPSMNVAPEAVVIGSDLFMARWTSAEWTRAYEEGIALEANSFLEQVREFEGITGVCDQEDYLVKLADEFCTGEAYDRRHAGDSWLPEQVYEAITEGHSDGHALIEQSAVEAWRQIHTDPADLYPAPPPSALMRHPGLTEAFVGLFRRPAPSAAEVAAEGRSERAQFRADEMLRTRQGAMDNYGLNPSSHFATMYRCELVAQAVEEHFLLAREDLAVESGAGSLPVTFDQAVSHLGSLAGPTQSHSR